MVLSTGPGRAVLVDAGPAPQDVDRCLTALDVHTLDAVVLTHFHADHVDGLPGAVGGRRVGAVLITIVDDPPCSGEGRSRLGGTRPGCRYGVTKAGERVAVGPVRWEDALAGPSGAGRLGTEQRQRRASGGGGGLQLCCSPATSSPLPHARLLPDAQSGSPGAVDVLRVAHHGSAKQDPGLLAQLSPRLALISVGADNEYGIRPTSRWAFFAAWAQPLPVQTSRGTWQWLHAGMSSRGGFRSAATCRRAWFDRSAELRLGGREAWSRRPGAVTWPSVAGDNVPACHHVLRRPSRSPADGPPSVEPLHLVTGPEDLLAERAISAVLAAGRLSTRRCR
jgi:competence protein ComEC